MHLQRTTDDYTEEELAAILFNNGTHEMYQELKEEAEQRVLNSTYGSVMYNLKLLRYVEYRAMREHGYVV